MIQEQSYCQRLKTGTCNCTAYCGEYLDNQRKKAQEPDVADVIAGALQTSRAHAYELMAAALKDAAQPEQQFTEGHCANKAQPGGCQLHNLQCGYPDCDRRMK